MSLTYSRSCVTDVVLTAFRRPLHPELFCFRGGCTVDHDTVTARLRICDNGHLLEFVTAGGNFYTEVLSQCDLQLPSFAQCLRRPVRGSRELSVMLDESTVYHVSYQVETVPPEVFGRIHEELRRDARQAAIAEQFPPRHRWAIPPLSLLTTESLPCGIVTHTVHTYPDEWAVVKTQTLLEVRSRD